MSLDPEKKLSLAIVLFAIAAQAAVLWPELYTAGVRDNDSVNHYTMTQQMVTTIEHGGNPLDFWSPEASLGMPMVRTYQPLAHILVAAAYFALGKSVPLMTVLVWARFLSMLVLPLSVYAAMVLLEFEPLTAAAGALLLPMIAGPGARGSIGVDIRSWVGLGVYPQTVATSLLLLSIGLGYQAIRRGKSVAVAGAVLGLTCLAHLMYGWMGAVTACLMTLLPDTAAPRWTRIRRVAALGAVALVLTFFQLVPLVTDHYLINRAKDEPIEKFDSYGAPQVLAWLFSGRIMDYDRIPALSLVCMVGIGVVVWRWRQTRKIAAQERFVVAGFVVWLLLFFGRPTWGVLLVLLGVGSDFHLHRLLALVQIFLLFLGAIGLATIWRETVSRWPAIVAAIVTAMLLAPMAVERVNWIARNEEQGWDTLAALTTEGPAMDRAIALAKERGGRVYAGMPENWALELMVGYTPVAAFLLLRQATALSVAYNGSVIPADVVSHFDELKPEQYRLFNVRTVIAPAVPDAPPFLAPVAQFSGFRVSDAPGAGYFGLVDVPAAAEVNRETVDEINEAWLTSYWLKRDQHIWLDLDGTAPRNLPRVSTKEVLPPVTEESAAGVVTNERQTGQVYEADFDGARAAYMLFRMTYHFCWKAYIDGQPAKTMMLTPGFLGVVAPAGKHHILCRYEPGNAKLWEAGAGVLLTLLCITAERLCERRPSSPG